MAVTLESDVRSQKSPGFGPVQQPSSAGEVPAAAVPGRTAPAAASGARSLSRSAGGLLAPAFDPTATGTSTRRALAGSGVTALQRAVGNQATLRLLQRQGPPVAVDSAIEKAIKSGDPNDIDAIQDFAQVSEADRIRFIGILVGFQGDAHGRIPFIWRSFPDDQFERVMVEHRELWDQSATGFGGPFEIMRPRLVEQVRRDYETALQEVATDNLTQNEKFVDTRMQEMGLKAGDAKPLPPEEIQKLRRAMQGLAWDVWSMRQSQAKLSNTVIGARQKALSAVSVLSILMGGEVEHVWFDPKQPPPEPELLEIWKPMKDEWDRAEDGITKAAGTYPEIFELVAGLNDDALLHFSEVTSESFGAQQQLLQTLLDRIRHVRDMVAHRDLDLMAFEPMQKRIAAGGGEWASGFKGYMADQLVKQHANDQSALKALADLGMNASILPDQIGLEEFGVVLGALLPG